MNEPDKPEHRVHISHYLDTIVDIYMAVYSQDDPDEAFRPITVYETLRWLKPHPVRELAARIQTRLNIDVIRLPDIDKSFSLDVAGHTAIVIPALDGQWFRQNWLLAREVGQLCTPTENPNTFAFNLLLPTAKLTQIDWANSTDKQTAQHIWDFGVSTTVLRNRLQYADLPVAGRVKAALALQTNELLTQAGTDLDGDDSPVNQAIERRIAAAGSRHFPNHLIRAHAQAVHTRCASPDALEWMLHG